MRADRLLSILLLLQVQGQMTARALAQRLEVSERTIHRDMEALSGAGIPVYAERGTGGGWELLEEYRTDLTGLNEPEIQALFAARPVHLLADLGLDQAVEAALIKLLAALPSTARRGATQAQQSIHIDVNGWQQHSEPTDQLPQLQAALAQERKLLLTYQRSDETVVERLVDPLGLVANRNVWYLIAAVDGEPRTYRVTRIQTATVTAAQAVRPADFDLAAYWEQAKIEFKAGLPTYYATIRVAPETVERLAWGGRYARIERMDPPDADGWQPVFMRFQFEEDAAAYILSYGTQVEVVEPLPLRDKVIQLAERVIAFYQQRA
ncbi:MAG: WYL domain-containing protein [Caldilineaceae bacterium]